MAWTEDYRSGMVQVDNGVLTAITGITRLRVNATSEIRKEMSGGAARNRAAHLVQVDPVINFTTVNLFDGLSVVGGAPLASTDVRAIGQKQVPGGVASGSVHPQYAATVAAVAPTSLTCDHQGNAQITYDVYAASSDGTTAPLIRSLVAMPALSTARRFELYDFSVAGNTLTGKRNVSINWNTQVVQEGADSTVYPTAVNLGSEQPVVTLRGVDPDWLTSIGIGGDRGTTANTILRFKDRDQLIAATQHISIAFNCAVSWNTVFDGGPEGPAEAEIQMDTFSAAGASPFTISTTIALT